MKTIQHSNLLAILVACPLFFACNPGKKNTDAPVTDTASAATPDTVSIQGIYTYSDELSSFIECGNDSTTYWVSDPDSLLGAEAKEFHFFPRNRSSVYAELDAVKLPPPPKAEGLAAEYDYLLKVISVTNVAAKNFQTECFPYDFWCLGTEPFWSVEISGAENIINLTDMGTESAYYYAYTQPVVEGDQYRYELPATDGQPALNITVKKETCSDGMSDRQYEYSVAVQAGERSLKGCAIAGTGIVQP